MAKYTDEQIRYAIAKYKNQESDLKRWANQDENKLLKRVATEIIEAAQFQPETT